MTSTDEFTVTEVRHGNGCDDCHKCAIQAINLARVTGSRGGSHEDNGHSAKVRRTTRQETRFEIREAGDLTNGDAIANVGTVLVARTEGMFVHVHVRAFHTWSPATGMSFGSLRDLFLHVTDEIVLVVK